MYTPVAKWTSFTKASEHPELARVLAAAFQHVV
jgi:hypothetical protein